MSPTTSSLTKSLGRDNPSFRPQILGGPCGLFLVLSSCSKLRVVRGDHLGMQFLMVSSYSSEPGPPARGGGAAEARAAPISWVAAAARIGGQFDDEFMFVCALLRRARYRGELPLCGAARTTYPLTYRRIGF